MPQLLIVRGLPGSGKSTFARCLLRAGWEHFEADQYFMKGEQYLYNGAQIGDAHQWCQEQVLKALQRGNNVVVSNTFTMWREMFPYMNMGFPYDVVTMREDYGSIHGVPPETIERMRARWEEHAVASPLFKRTS